MKAIAYADLIQGISLLVGGMIIFFVALNASGGWTEFSTANAGKLKILLYEGHPGYEELPWHTVFSGMWIVMIYYCGLNQFIVQRNLAAKTLRDGQLGMIFAGGCASGALWRAGEGHLKLWVTLLTFSWTGSLFRGFLGQQGILASEFDISFMSGVAETSALGFQAFLPDILGSWSATFAASFIGLSLIWWILREKS